jgi:hypothetical protein
MPRGTGRRALSAVRAIRNVIQLAANRRHAKAISTLPVRQSIHDSCPEAAIMPLKPGSSRATIQENIRKLIAEGYTPQQAAAIAYAEARKRK